MSSSAAAFVVPAKAGTQNGKSNPRSFALDSGLRRNDGAPGFKLPTA